MMYKLMDQGRNDFFSVINGYLLGFEIIIAHNIAMDFFKGYIVWIMTDKIIKKF